jgi:hypothetical protein
MEPLVRAAAEGLLRAGWHVDVISEGRNLPWHIRRRYLGLPSLAEDFICHLGDCVRGDEQVWFLTATDYARKGGEGFAWDEFEKMLLEDADEEQASEVRSFWDKHLPILMDVGGDYRFLAVCMDVHSDRLGKIVTGDLIDYDAPVVVADSYAEMLDMIRKGTTRDPRTDEFYDTRLNEFLHADLGDQRKREKEGLLARLRGWFGS